jgi:hypothetical protein
MTDWYKFWSLEQDQTVSTASDHGDISGLSGLQFEKGEGLRDNEAVMPLFSMGIAYNDALSQQSKRGHKNNELTLRFVEKRYLEMARSGPSA